MNSIKKEVTPMRITRIKGKNFICLKEIDLPITSKLTRIIGKNATGKTSCLTLIEAVMQGMTPSMVRNGEEKAEGSLEIDDGTLVIERTQKITGQGTCKILAPFEMPDGKKKMRPLPVPTQEYLKSLVSDKAFRPLDLLILKDKERANYFRKIFKTTLKPEMLTGIIEQEDIDRLDFSRDGMEIIEDITGNKGILYLRRSEINKSLKQKEALLQQKKSELGNEFDVSLFQDQTEGIEIEITKTQTVLSEAKAKQQAALSSQRIIEREQKTINEAIARLEQIDQKQIDAIPALQEEITRLQTLLTQTKAKLEEAIHVAKEKDEAIQAKERSEETIATIKVEVPDIVPIETRLNEFLEKRIINQKEIAIVSLDAEVSAIKDRSDSITDTIEKLRKDITQRIVEEADMPIKDLHIIGDDIFIGDRHIDLMSTREQVNIVIQIVEWMNKDKPLKVVCLDRAEVLDDESLEALAEAIPEGYRFFLAEVYHEGWKIPHDAVMINQGNKIIKE